MSDETELRNYLAKVERAYRAGNATEHTYRPALKALLETLVPGITATNEPKRVACGAPDFAISRSDISGPRTLGWVEAKDIGVSLDETERSDQLKNRYLPNLPNLILTDYLEFRWYVDGKPRMRVRLATVGAGGKLLWDAERARSVIELLTAMLTQRASDITSAEDLAQRMARMAHMIKDVALDTLRSEDKEGGEQVRAAREELTDLCKTFQKALIPDLTDEAFADMFAQTLAYGLFAARYNHTGAQAFTRRDASREIPRSNPFLRRLFAAIESPDLEDAPYIGFVDDLAHLLAATDMSAVLHDFGKRTRTEDPIVHFYEPFLQAYDPKLRELRGVYYTPEPVVSYIVRSVDALLKRDFALPEGLASGDGAGRQSVVVLDPACGTGTFLSSAINLIRERFRASNNAGAWASYVSQRLLPRVFGFELLMAPYAMAHLRLGMQFAGLDLPESERERWTFQAGEGERLGVYLTNTLDQAAKQSERLFRGQFITDEANAATRIKRDAPVMVVLGNPPYSGHSANNSDWIMALLRGEDLTNTQGDKPLDRGKGRKTANYFEVDGKPLGERNPKWLNDDYVKFIRFAQWRIERTGHGVLAFITNHGYLDNPTFRGMRQSLMRTFDEIYVLDLHGNSKKQERGPDGATDQNVFDIQQGVAIGIFVRHPDARGVSRNATLRHAHLRGTREGKYTWLEEHDVDTTAWTTLSPEAPFYLFVPQDTVLRAEYESGCQMPRAMPVNVLGFQTHRDQFAIDFERDALLHRFAEMRNERISDHEFAEKYELSDNRDWQLGRARKAIRKDGSWPSRVMRCLYRPLDERWCYFSEVAMDYPRRELMQHVAGRHNLCIGLGRQGLAVNDPQWSLIAVAREPVDANIFRRGGINIFPLYLYPDTSKSTLFEEPQTGAPGGRRPNFAPEFIVDFAERLRMTWVADGKGDRERTFGPEDVLDYMYAVLHSPTYRARYAEFLKIDFPRLPLTNNPDLFRELAALGDRLIALHLMEKYADRLIGFPVPGDNTVSKGHYTAPREGAEKGRVYINNDQYFDGVPPEVWEFRVGGFQVCEKWLKDRKGRVLNYDDLEHYHNMVAALAETIRLMDNIDETIEEHGGWPLV